MGGKIDILSYILGGGSGGGGGGGGQIDPPTENGDYVVRHANGTDSFVALQTALEGTLDRITALEGEKVNVTGETPGITCKANGQYICGTVTSISITPCVEGVCDIIFTSGTTPAVLTLPSTVLLPEWFDKTALAANTVYEINIMDGVYGAVMAWGA